MQKTATILLDSVILDWNMNILLFLSIMWVQSLLQLFTIMNRNQAKAAAVQKDEINLWLTTRKSHVFKVKTHVIHGKF